MNVKFARIPERVALARRRGELSFDEHAVLVLLVEDADYRSGEVVGTLRSFADGWGWHKSLKQLGRVLHALRDVHHEIAFDVEERQRKPWVIGVVGSGFGMHCDTRTASGVAVTETRADGEDARRLAKERSPRSSRLRHASPTDADTDLDVDIDKDSAPESDKKRDSGWPEHLGQRTLGDLLAACALVENLETGIDRGTLKAFVVDELAVHDAADFEHVLGKLHKRRAGGAIRSEAAFARSLLHDIVDGYEVLPGDYRQEHDDLFRERHNKG